MNVKCEICGKECRALSVHISKKHQISPQQYYDKYLRKENEGKCLLCGNPTKFKTINVGYHTYCSKNCAASDPNIVKKRNEKFKQTMLNKYGYANPLQVPYIKEKVKNTCKERYDNEYAIASDSVKAKIIEHNQEKYGVNYPLENKTIRQKTQKSIKEHYGVDNPSFVSEIQDKARITRKQNRKLDGYTTVEDLVIEYGLGWYHARDILGIIIHKEGMYSYVNNDDIDKIIDYYEYHNNGHKSYFEYNIINFVKSIYKNEIITNSRKVIPPLEIDIYLPELKLAIECNGTYWHSTDQIDDISYHLNKSLLARDKQIRLIHIYEFEDIDKQKRLLENLIQGKDNYPKDDFNKNNLIENIPKAEIIYDERCTVYGAGKLY